MYSTARPETVRDPGNPPKTTSDSSIEHVTLTATTPPADQSPDTATPGPPAQATPRAANVAETTVAAAVWPAPGERSAAAARAAALAAAATSPALFVIRNAPITKNMTPNSAVTAIAASTPDEPRSPRP